MREFLIGCLLFAAQLLPSGAHAQEEFIEPSRLLTSFRFEQLTGGIVLVKGQLLPFKDTLNFVFDTGSGGISLDSATAVRLKLEPTPSNRIIRGIAGIRNVSFINNKSLRLPGLRVDSLNFHVNDYSLLEAVYGLKIDGIMGYSVLSRYIIKVDYDSLRMEFWSKGTMKYPRGGFLMRPAISSIPVQALRVKDADAINSRFLFDVGAGLNMMLSTEFLRDSGLLKRKRRLYAKEAEGLGGKVDMHVTVIQEVKIGPYKFKKVPVYVFDDQFNITSYPYLGGILGNDLLRRFNIILNYDKRQFHLTPNSHFYEAFDYVYTGLDLYYVDSSIIVGDVARNSPAERAGLKEGDRVIAINQQFNNDLQTYKTAIQNTGNRLRIIVMRNEELKEFNFKVKSLLK